MSTDMPFGDADPWAAMRAAVHRTTASGAVLGPAERIDARHRAADVPRRPRAADAGRAPSRPASRRTCACSPRRRTRCCTSWTPTWSPPRSSREAWCSSERDGTPTSEYCEINPARIGLSMDMEHFTFGRNNGLRVSALALGAGNFGTRWGYGADETAQRARWSTGSPRRAARSSTRPRAIRSGSPRRSSAASWPAAATSSPSPPSSPSAGPPTAAACCRPATAGARCSARSRRACVVSTPTTSTCCGCTSRTSSPRSRRSCAPSTISAARARCSTPGCPTFRRG